MYKTKQDIIDFVNNYQGRLNTEADKAKFAAELGEQVKQMDFRAENGGAAIAYSGWFGTEEGVQSQMFRTAQNISANSNGAYSFINDTQEAMRCSRAIFFEKTYNKIQGDMFIKVYFFKRMYINRLQKIENRIY